MPDFDQIDELKQELYRRGKTPPPPARSPLPEGKGPSPSWPEGSRPPRAWLTPRLARFLTLGTALFFVAMVGITVLVFYRGSNLVSSGNVTLAVTGPQASRSGEEVLLDVRLENRNPGDLILVDLTVEYPPGTRSAADPTKELTRDRLSLGTIRSGDSHEETIRAIPFGGIDSELPFGFTVEYRLRDSNAIFDKTTVHPIKISAVPLAARLEAPGEINDNQDVVLKLELSSNATVPLPPMLVLADYPSGFVFREASPAPQTDNRLWRLPALDPGAKQTIRLVGTLSGQAEEQKFFRVTAGTASAESPEQVAVPYALAETVVTINRPGVALELALNGSTGNEYVAASRELVRGQLTWTNNLSVPIENVEITLNPIGGAVDKTAISASHGFYQSATNQLVWNKSSEPDLASIAPGARGRVEFSLPIASLVSGPAQINPAITLNTRFRGSQSGGGGEVLAEAAPTIKVSSAVQLAAKALYRSGPFPNRGPLPPRVGEETTYTVTWSVVNSSNNLTGATVKALLPPYVRWLGAATPATESLTFNPYESGGGELTWQLGQLAAGTGLSTAAREVSFQISLVPSSSQAGQIPTLVLEPRLDAFDTFTSQDVAVGHRELTTFLIADPLFTPGEDQVQP